MKLDFTHIKNPQIDGKHKITGHLQGGTTVIVERHLDSWKPNLKITVGDYVQHDAPASLDEQEEWLKLRTRAQRSYDAGIQGCIDHSKEQAKILFGR